MSEIITADEWLYATLSGDATLIAAVGTRIYGHVAPNSATFPLIIFAPVDNPTDLMVVNAKRVWSDGTWQVKVVSETQSLAGLEAIADRIDTLLHRQSGSGVVACVRQGPLSYIEIVDGVQYRHLGGLYRIQVQ